MADGSIIIDTHIDNAQAQKDLANLRKKITKLSSDLGSKTSKQNAIASEMDKASAAAEETRNNIRQLKSEIASLEAVNLSENTSAQYLSAQSRLPELRARLDEQNAKLRTQGDAADKVAAEYEKITAEIDRISNELDEAGAKAKNLALEVTGGGGRESTAEALNRAATATTKFKKRIIELTKSALIFSVLTRALTVMRNWLGNAVAASEEASAAFAQFKGTLQGLAAPILNSVIPVLTRVVQVITQIISLLSRGVSALFGMTNKQALDNAKGLNAQQKALEGVGGAASDAEKQLASFDEINKLTEPSAGGGGGGGGEIAPTFEEIQLPEWLTETAQKLTDAFGRLREVWEKFKENPKAQKAFEIIKDFLKVLTKSAINGLTNTINALASLVELLDALAKGDWESAFEKFLGFLGDIATLLAAPTLDIAQWLLNAFGAEVDLDQWWKEDIAPYFTAKKHKKLWTDAYKGWDQGWKYVQSNNGVAMTAWWEEYISPWFTAEKWETLIGGIKGGIEAGWRVVNEVWKTTIGNWWSTNVAPWFTAGKWQSVVSGVKDGLVYGFKQAMNAVIDYINEGIRLINRGLIWQLYDGHRLILGKLDTIPNIPYLAEGAVIPPNREFMAVLGDQKSGTNIETPLSTMIEAFRTALNEGGYGGARTVVLEVDGRELGRATFDAYNAEARRLGVSLEVSNA